MAQCNKLHPSVITDLDTLPKLDNLWLYSSVPMFADSSMTLTIDNPCSLEVVNLQQIRFADQPTLTIKDANGYDLYVTQPMIMDDGNASVAGSTTVVQWADIQNHPATYAPSAHNHAWSEITSGKPTTIAGYGITDAFTQTLADARYPQLGVQYTNPTWLAGIDATTIKTGTIDLARLPALPSANTIVCTTIPAMTAGDQALVAKGTVVIESTTGNTYRYSGSGSVVLNASYIQQSDLTPDWAVITNKPTLISTWTNDSGYLTPEIYGTINTWTAKQNFGDTSAYGYGSYTLWGNSGNDRVIDVRKKTDTNARIALYENGTLLFADGAGGTLGTLNGITGGLNTPGDMTVGGTLISTYCAQFTNAWIGTNSADNAVDTVGLRNSAIATAVAGYSPTSHTHTFASLTSKPTTLAGYSILASDPLFDAKYLGINANAASATKLQTARTIAGVAFDGTSSISIPFANLTSIPSTFSPSAHTHAIADTTGLQTALDAKLSIASAASTYQPLGAYLTLSSVLTGYAVGANTAIAATDSVLGAFQKLQGQINNKQASGSYALSTHIHSWSDITKPTTISNFVDGAWAGGTPYYGWSFTGASTRFGFSSTTGVVDVYADGNFYATDSSYLVWHAGNLTGDQSGHYHSSDRAWGNITSKPSTIAGYGITDGITGSGSSNTIPLFNGSKSIGDSFLIQDTAWGVLNIKQTPQNSQLGIAYYNKANDHIWQNTFRTTDNKLVFSYYDGTNWNGERMSLDPLGNLYASGTGTIGLAKVGTSTSYAGWAEFSNSNVFGGGSYALLQNSDGTTNVNCASGKAINFCNGNGASIMTIASNLITANQPINGTSASFSGTISGVTHTTDRGGFFGYYKPGALGYAFIGDSSEATMGSSLYTTNSAMFGNGWSTIRATDSITFQIANAATNYQLNLLSNSGLVFYKSNSPIFTIDNTTAAFYKPVSAPAFNNTDIITLSTGGTTTTLSAPVPGRMRLIYCTVNDSQTYITYNNSAISVQFIPWPGNGVVANGYNPVSANGAMSWNLSGVSGVGGYAPRIIMEYCVSATRVLFICG